MIWNIFSHSEYCFFTFLLALYLALKTLLLLIHIFYLSHELLFSYYEKPLLNQTNSMKVYSMFSSETLVLAHSFKSVIRFKLTFMVWKSDWTSFFFTSVHPVVPEQVVKKITFPTQLSWLLCCKIIYNKCYNLFLES